MKSKLTKLLVVVLAVFTAVVWVPFMDSDADIFSIEASAATASGSLGGSVKWSYNNETKTLTVTGSGAMSTFTATPSVFTSKNSTVGVVIRDDATRIVINNGPTNIGAYAFHSFKNVTSVTIASSVKTIAERAFQGCTSLASITIPGSVTSIANSVFEGCTALTSVSFSSGLTSIGNYCFKNAKIASFTAPSTLKTIGTYAFVNCTSLTSVSLNSALTTLSANAFQGCTRLATITIPGNVKTLSENLFKNCTSLTTVVLSSGVTGIKANTFDGCSKFQNLTIPSSFTLGKTVFEDDSFATFKSALKTITFATGCKTIGERAFYGFTGLTTVNIPSTVTTLSKSAFEGCTSLENVNLSEGLKTIGDYCFKLTKFADVDLPRSVTSVGTHAFANISGLNIRCNYGDAAYNEAIARSLKYTFRTPEFIIESSVDAATKKLNVVLKLKNASGLNAANFNITYNSAITPVSTETQDISNSEIMGTVVYNSTGRISVALMSSTAIPYAKCTGECEYKIAEFAFDIPGEDDTATFAVSSKAFMLGDKRLTVASASETTNLHIYTDSSVITTATCKDFGAVGYECIVCDKVVSEPTAKNPDNHAGGTEIRNASVATCKDTGYTGDTYCLGCGVKTVTGTAIAVNASNHTGGTEVRGYTASTCTQNGYTGDTYCKGCNAKTASGSSIAKVPHNESIIEGYAATCTETGLTDGVECTVGGEIITAQEIIPATGHSNSVTTDPAHARTGYISYQCSVCEELSYTPITYTVKYNANGGKGTMSNSTHTYDTAKALNANAFTLTGHILAGWTTTSGSSTVMYTDAQSVKNLSAVNGSTVTLYAIWKPVTYQVKYNANGGTGTMANSTHTYGVESALSRNTFTRTGYKFLGWSKTKTAETVSYTDGYKVKGLTGVQGKVVVIYAIWAPDTYTVKYNANGGTGSMSDSALNFGVSQALSANAYTRTGYTFLGWATSKTATTAEFTDSQSVKDLITPETGSLTLYAVWKPITYSVSYNANGGKGTMANSSHTYGVSKALSANAYTRTGYTFLGWAKTKTATTPNYTDGKAVSGLTGVQGKVVTIYAVWKPITYSVRYNANGGKGTMADSSHTFGVAQALSANTYTRTGYTFLGWAKIKTDTTPNYVDGKEVSGLTGVQDKVVVLYAVWKPNTFYVAYNANGGNGTMENSTHTFGVAQALTANVYTRTGYTFLGWARSKSATTPDYVDCKEVSGLTGVDGRVVTLYAVWKPITYSVRYNANGGKGTMADSAHTYGVSKALSANTFTRAGYTFLGWSKTKSATTASYTDGKAVSGLTGVQDKVVVLYAIWKKN